LFNFKEIGDTYLDYLDSKLKMFEKSSGPWEPRLLQKMAYLCKQGIAIHESILV
jgi:hypothetical protein